MNKTDEEIREGWKQSDIYHVDMAIKHLKQQERSANDFLAECVAAVCDVALEEMFSLSDSTAFAHARWLYWYAYRYMSNESYDKIAKISSKQGGHWFAQRTIQNGANRMAMMIEEEPFWKKRWTVIKHVIKLREPEEDKKVDNTIIIQVPRELKETINIKIQEK